ncbi:MAG: hypothetical protein GX964_01165 [Syntrophomonadaceae bacterium]|jgi:hypothetical protein|nr:hypothetical protein [Syntrophomonadaceae bacterium]
MDNRLFMYTLVNKLLLAASETMQPLPDGRTLLERIIEGLSDRVLDQFEKDLYPLGNDPVDWARAWIRLLSRQGFVVEEHYEFEEIGDNIEVRIFNGSCSYREYCRQADREGLLFVCPRMQSIKWIISKNTGPHKVVPRDMIHDHYCVAIIASLLQSKE